MEHSDIVKNRWAYTASTPNIKIDAQNIKELVMSLDFLQSGATPPTLADLLGHTTDIKLTIGGEVHTLVRLDDLFVLNHLWLNPKNKPFYLLPAADTNVGTFEGLKLPVCLTTDKPVNVALTYVGHATVTTEKLTLEARYRDRPFNAKAYSFQYITDNIATSYKNFDFDQSGKMLEAILLYMTTIPTVTSLDATIGELKLLHKTKEKYHTNILTNRGSFHPELTTIGGILDNYVLIKLPEKYPADSLKLRMKSLASATDAFRAIGIYR